MNKDDLPITLPGDFATGFTSADARNVFDCIAERTARIVEIIEANPKGLTGAARAEVGLLARLAGLQADGTAGDMHAYLNAVWGILFVAKEVEAQALAAVAIDKARAPRRP